MTPPPHNLLDWERTAKYEVNWSSRQSLAPSWKWPFRIFRRGGKALTMTILQEREQTGKTVDLQLAQKKTRVPWETSVLTSSNKNLGTICPGPLFSVNLHLHTQELLLPYSEPQSGLHPGGSTFPSQPGSIHGYFYLKLLAKALVLRSEWTSKIEWAKEAQIEG